MFNVREDNLRVGFCFDQVVKLLLFDWESGGQPASLKAASASTEAGAAWWCGARQSLVRSLVVVDADRYSISKSGKCAARSKLLLSSCS